MILYIKSVSKKFRNIINNIVSRSLFFSINKLCEIIKAQKDLFAKLSNMNVIYKLSR